MKRLFFIFLLSIFGGILFAQSVELAFYTEAYNHSQTIREQLVFVRNIADGNYPGSEDFFARALDRLMRMFPDITERSEMDAADSIALIVANRLGEARHTPSALSLLNMVNSFANSHVRAEALMAIGKIGDMAFFPHVRQLLLDLNTRPQSDRTTRDNAENTASGAIISLGHFGAPEGYMPVFLAYTGWYAQRVRNLAAATMSELMSDPTEPLIEVITATGFSYDIKHSALRASEMSDSTDENKARVAVAALAEGWKHQVTEVRQRQELAQMRKLALTMLRRYGTEDNSVYPLLDRSFNNGDMDEKLVTLHVLNTLPTPDSARLLSGYLRNIHQRRLNNTLTSQDEQLVRVIIPALGNVGSMDRAASRPILLLIRNAPNWQSTIQRLATDALDRIGV